MTTYRNANFTKRNHETTNIVACQTDESPSERGDMKNMEWTPAVDGILDGLTHLYSCQGVRYFGYL